jgi:hypothetical protein
MVLLVFWRSTMSEVNWPFTPVDFLKIGLAKNFERARFDEVSRREFLAANLSEDTLYELTLEVLADRDQTALDTVALSCGPWSNEHEMFLDAVGHTTRVNRWTAFATLDAWLDQLPLRLKAPFAWPCYGN